MVCTSLHFNFSYISCSIQIAVKHIFDFWAPYIYNTLHRYWEMQRRKTEMITWYKAILRQAAHHLKASTSSIRHGCYSNVLFCFCHCFVVSEITAEGKSNEYITKSASPFSLKMLIPIQMKFANSLGSISANLILCRLPPHQLISDPHVNSFNTESFNTSSILG